MKLSKWKVLGMTIILSGVTTFGYFLHTSYGEEDITPQEFISVEATFPDLSTEELKKESELVVKGTPQKIDQVIMDGEENPITVFSFEVSSTYKNTNSDDSKVIHVYQDGDATLQYAEHPLMELNKEYVLFLEKYNDSYLMLGGPSGKFENNGNPSIMTEQDPTYSATTDKSITLEELEGLQGG